MLKIRRDRSMDLRQRHAQVLSFIRCNFIAADRTGTQGGGITEHNRQPCSGASSNGRSCYGCRIAMFQETVARSSRPWVACCDAGKCCVTKSMAFSSLL